MRIIRELWRRFFPVSPARAKCDHCGLALSEWFVWGDFPYERNMYCYGGCRRVSPWRSHAEFRERSNPEYTR